MFSVVQRMSRQIAMKEREIEQRLCLVSGIVTGNAYSVTVLSFPSIILLDDDDGQVQEWRSESKAAGEKLYERCGHEDSLFVKRPRAEIVHPPRPFEAGGRHFEEFLG